MNSLDIKSRFAFTVAISYLVPLLFFYLFLFNTLPVAVGFWSLAISWFLLAAGTLLTFIAALFYENELLQQKSPDRHLIEENHHLQHQIQEMKRKVREEPQDPELKSKLEELAQELENARSQGLQHLQDKEKLVAELQNALARQKKSIDEKDVILSKLQMKVTELTYEIKSLVQFTTTDEEPISKPAYFAQDSSLLLRKCIEIAQQHTGAWSFNPRMSRGSDLSIDSYALDQRRLYQSLNREKGGLIFLYSPKDEKVIYVNPSVKNFLNLTTESFIQDFPRLIENSRQTFQETLKTLSGNQQAQITLNLKGQPPLNCHMGIIPTGLFKNHVVGVVTY